MSLDCHMRLVATTLGCKKRSPCVLGAGDYSSVDCSVMAKDNVPGGQASSYHETRDGVLSSRLYICKGTCITQFLALLSSQGDGVDRALR